MSLVWGIWGAFVVEAMLQMQGGALLRRGMPERALAVQTQAGVPSDAGVESAGLAEGEATSKTCIVSSASRAQKSDGLEGDHWSCTSGPCAKPSHEASGFESSTW